MFNLTGGEIVILLLIGLVVLGPEKLPDAMRRFGRVYDEVRRVATGIQRDVTSTFSDPVEELKKTANDARRLFTGDVSTADSEGPSTDVGAKDPDEPRFIPYEATEDQSTQDRAGEDGA